MGTDNEIPALPACRFGSFRLDPAGRRLTDEAGNVLPLSGRAFDVLEHLVRHRNRVVSKEELLSAVWPRVVVEENNLTQAVSAIRRALHDSRESSEYVATVPGRGYRFVAALHEGSPGPVTPSPTTAVPGPRPPTRAGYWRSPAYAASAALFLIAALGMVALRHESIRPGASQSATTVARPERPVIAVLPFYTSGTGENAQLMAQSVTDLLRGRLAQFSGAVVIGSSSASELPDRHEVRDVAARLRARYLLQGRVERTGEALGIDAVLIDATSAAGLWSASFSPVTDLGATARTLVQRVADTLQLAGAPAVSSGSVNLEAYELYMQGQRLSSTLRADDNERAIELFRRATILDPSFAPGYLALGQAGLQAARLRRASVLGHLTRGQAQLPASGGASREELTEARQALDRALELDPGLGEVWIERAGFESDAAKADELYRRGLQLAPNYGAGYLRYSQFLFDNYRKGEAVDMIDRARQIDPLTPSLHLRKAFLLMVTRSDVEGHDRLVREALEINPRLQPALMQLAWSRHEFSGAFADGIRLIEQSIAVDPRSEVGVSSAVRMYLDVDDPDAALVVARESRQPAEALVEVAQYQRDFRRAARHARSRSTEQWELGSVSPAAEAVRDEAIRTGDYASALELLQSQYAMSLPPGGALRMWSRGLGLVYAHTLILAGQAQRGRELVRAILVQIDSESVGRTRDWFSRERAAAYAALGDEERALAELEASARTLKFYRWWYVADCDPLYEHLRSNPRFQALAEQALQHRRSQRALLEELRRKGEVPPRVS